MITSINEFKKQLNINEASRLATDLEKDVFEFLNDLRLSGVTNMYGAVPYILREYPDLDKNVASKLLGLWMKNFNENGDYDTINEQINIITGEYSEFDKNTEILAAKEFKYEPKSQPVIVVNLNAEIMDDYNTTVEIELSNNDTISYHLNERSRKPSDQGAPPYTDSYLKINDNIVEENDLDWMAEFSNSSIIGTILAYYTHWKNIEINWKNIENKKEHKINENLEKVYTEQDLESAFEAGVDSVEYDENHGYINKTNFRDFLTAFKSNEDKVIENIDTAQLPKALEDIDERRPNRMKRPSIYGYSNEFAGRGGVPGTVYIQDEAQKVMQDKYGRERGTRMWEASINAPQRGAMFKMADDVMKEKLFLYKQAGLIPRTYWDASYYALWKMWMESQGLSYKVDSDEDVSNKKAEKERLEREENEKKAQAIKDQKLKQFNGTVESLIKYVDIEPSDKPDSKDMARIASMMSKNDPVKMASAMASAIKDRSKALRRGLAVIEWFKQNRPTDYYGVKSTAEPFLDKAKQL